MRMLLSLVLIADVDILPLVANIPWSRPIPASGGDARIFFYHPSIFFKNPPPTDATEGYSLYIAGLAHDDGMSTSSILSRG